MKKGFLTIDVIVALGLLVLSFMFFIRYVNFLWSIDDFLASSLPVSSAVAGFGSTINSIYALTPLSYGSPLIVVKAYGGHLCFIPRNESASHRPTNCKTPGSQMWVFAPTSWNRIPGNTIYRKSSDLEFFVNITNKTFTNLRRRIGFVSESPGSLGQYNMSIVYDDRRHYSYLSFGKYESGDVVVESYSGSYSRSCFTPENISVITCSEFLELLNSSGFSYGALSLYPGAPWNCHESCQGVSDIPCVYSCKSSDCDSKCSAAGIDISVFNNPLGTSSGLECKIFGPYWNETNVINDTCGGFPPFSNCSSVPYNRLYEGFWVRYGFWLDAVPAGDVFVNAIARNGVIVAVNGHIVSCTASSLYSEVHPSIREYLIPNAYNEILIAFLRTDSICGPCVSVRPAYGVGGMWKISCSPVTVDTGYYGWMGCDDYLTVKCESNEFTIGEFSITDSTKPEVTFDPESGGDLTEVTVHVQAEDPYPGSGVAAFGYRVQDSSVCPTTSSSYTFVIGTSVDVSITTSGTWYICAYAKDGAGNVAIEKGGPYTISSVYVNINSIDDYVNSLGEITGSSSGEPFVLDVRLLIEDTTNGSYWSGSTWLSSPPSSWPLTDTSDNYVHWKYSDVPTWVHGHSYNISALAVSATEEDNATAFEHFTYDVVPPLYVSYSPNSSHWYNSAVTVTLSGHDDVSGVERVYYKVVSVTDNCPSCASGYDQGSSFTLFSEGYHKVCMCAVDKAGNMMTSPNSTVYKIDTTPPSVTINDIEDNSTPSVIEGTADDSLSGVKYVKLLIYDKNTSLYWNGVAWNSSLVELDTSYSLGSWSYDASGVLWVENHTYVLTARAYDRANNLKTASDSFIK